MTIQVSILRGHFVAEVAEDLTWTVEGKDPGRATLEVYLNQAFGPGTQPGLSYYPDIVVERVRAMAEEFHGEITGLDKRPSPKVPEGSDA